MSTKHANRLINSDKQLEPSALLSMNLRPDVEGEDLTAPFI